MADVSKLGDMARTVMAILEDEILSCREQIQALMEKNAQNLRQMEAWKIILQTEEEKELLKIPETDYMQLGETLGKLALAQASELPQLSTAIGDEAYGSKMVLVRQLLSVAASEGVTPKELGVLLGNTGAKVSSSFAGNALHKMKGRGEVVFHAGRYYLPMFAPATAPGFINYADQSLGVNLRALLAYVNQEKINYASLPKENQAIEKPLLNKLVASVNAANAAYLACHSGTETLEAAQAALASAWQAQVEYIRKEDTEVSP